MVANRLVSVYGASPARHFDVRLGNPPNLSLAGSRGRAIQVRAADEFVQTVLPAIRAIQAAGTTSFASIADVLNERGIKSARGGKWHVSERAWPDARLVQAIVFFIDGKKLRHSTASVRFRARTNSGVLT